MIAPEIAARHHRAVEVDSEVRKDQEARRAPHPVVGDQLLDELAAVVAGLVEVVREGDDRQAGGGKARPDRRGGRRGPPGLQLESPPQPRDLVAPPLPPPPDTPAP